MDNLIERLPDNLPAWAVIMAIIVIVIGIIWLAKVTGNNTKQSNNIGSNNTFHGNSQINQQIGGENTNSKDSP